MTVHELPHNCGAAQENKPIYIGFTPISVSPKGENAPHRKARTI